MDRGARLLSGTRPLKRVLQRAGHMPWSSTARAVRCGDQTMCASTASASSTGRCVFTKRGAPPAGHAGRRVLLQRVQLVRSTSPRECAKDALEAEQAYFCAQGPAPEQARRKHTNSWDRRSVAAHRARCSQTDVRAWVFDIYLHAMDQTRGCGSSGAETAATLWCVRPGAPSAERLLSASALRRQ